MGGYTEIATGAKGATKKSNCIVPFLLIALAIVAALVFATTSSKVPTDPSAGNERIRLHESDIADAVIDITGPDPHVPALGHGEEEEEDDEQEEEEDTPWRADGRCGKDYLNSVGEPAQCNPDSTNSCCSHSGWCGQSVNHCDCTTCIDYAPDFCAPVRNEIWDGTFLENRTIHSYWDCCQLCKAEPVCTHVSWMDDGTCRIYLTVIRYLTGYDGWTRSREHSTTWGGFDSSRVVNHDAEYTVLGSNWVEFRDTITSSDPGINTTFSLTNILSASYLNSIDIFSPTRGDTDYDGTLSESEQLELLNWVSAGGILIVFLDYGDHAAQAAVTFLEPFGIADEYTAQKGHITVDIPESSTHELLHNVDRLYFNDFSSFSEGPAQVLVTIPSGETVVALSEHGYGAVLVLPDYNSLTDSSIDAYNNRQFAANIASWALSYDPCHAILNDKLWCDSNGNHDVTSSLSISYAVFRSPCGFGIATAFLDGCTMEVTFDDQNIFPNITIQVDIIDFGDGAFWTRGACDSSITWGGFDSSRMAFHLDIFTLTGPNWIEFRDKISSSCPISTQFSLTNILTASYLNSIDIFSSTVYQSYYDDMFIEIEQLELSNWVSAGGILVVFLGRGVAASAVTWLEPFGIADEYTEHSAKAPVDVSDSSIHELLHNVQAIYLDGFASFSEGPAHVLVATSSGDTVVAVLEHGNGAVLVLPDTGAFMDSYIDESDNKQFVANIVSWAQSYIPAPTPGPIAGSGHRQNMYLSAFLIGYVVFCL